MAKERVGVGGVGWWSDSVRYQQEQMELDKS